MSRKVRLAYLVTHPIQYQAPLLRRIAEEPDIDLTVFFCSDFSVAGFMDRGFGRTIEWDVPLLEGYRHEFLPAFGRKDAVSFWRPLNYGLARRLRQGRFDVLWVHGYARLFHWAAIVAAKRLGMKVLLRDEATRISAQRGPIKRLFKRAFMLWLRSVCDGFLAIGSANRDYYRSYGVADERIFLMPYAVDNEFFAAPDAGDGSASVDDLRQRLRLDPGRPVILFASKLIARKRPHDLLDAYARLSEDGRAEPHPYLLFVGDGPERESLERRVTELDWHSVRILGFCNQRELPAYYRLCDVFVLPSVDEPWGLVVNEVMNAGRPVIVSDRVGCARDLVCHGENGYLFEAGNVGDLRKALGQILYNPVRCRAMGRRSQEIVKAWDFEADVDGLTLAVQRVLDGARSAVELPQETAVTDRVAE